MRHAEVLNQLLAALRLAHANYQLAARALVASDKRVPPSADKRKINSDATTAALVAAYNATEAYHDELERLLYRTSAPRTRTPDSRPPRAETTWTPVPPPQKRSPKPEK